METKQLTCEIKDESDTQSLIIGLYVEGHKVATAAASRETLQDIQSYLGMSRDVVRAELEKALRDYLSATLEQVRIETPIKDPQQKLKFMAAYIFHDDSNIWTGYMWYDVETDTMGPEDAPIFAKHKLKTLVHKMLVKRGGIAEELIDLVTSD